MHLHLTYADVLKIVTAKQACEYLLAHNVPLTKIATGTYLRGVASTYTRKHYPRSRNGLELALYDLGRLEAAIKAAQP